MTFITSICATCGSSFVGRQRKDRPLGQRFCSISCGKQGANNCQWQGNNVGYWAIHDWARDHFIAPEACEHCGAKGKHDWASKAGNYTRNREDWLRLCRSCHFKHDRKTQQWGNSFKKARLSA